MNFETKCVHAQKDISAACDKTGAISFPIYQSSTFAHPGPGQSTGYDYTRMQNPTREQLENVVAGLENGDECIAFSSGMAAISAVMELFKPGDHVIIDEDLYGGTIRLFQHVNEKNGITFTRVNFSEEDIRPHIGENTRAVFFETPTNPMMNVADIEKISAIAHEHGLLCIVDNTFLSPYLQNPLALGADLVIHSGTKYLGGHNDTIAGFVVTKTPDLTEKLRFLIKTTGAALAPFDSWLILRGIKTLAIRIDRMQENTAKIVDWLTKQKAVTRVYYPGLSDHPGHEIMKKQSRGFGSMVTFEVESKEKAIQILNDVDLILYAESLAGTETLITYPLTQTHADVPPEFLEKNGITDRVLRLSVGIEAAEDLIAELDRVINSN